MAARAWAEAAGAAAAAVVAEWEARMTQSTCSGVQTMSFAALSLKTLAASVALSLASFASFAQKAYPTPDAAAQAFVDALSRSDVEALRSVLGPE